MSHDLTPQRQVLLTSHITDLEQPKIGVLHGMIKEGLVKGVVVDDLECATDFLFDASRNDIYTFSKHSILIHCPIHQHQSLNPVYGPRT